MTHSIKREGLPERKQTLADLLKKATTPYPLDTSAGELLVKRLSLSSIDALGELIPKGVDKYAADLDRLGALAVQNHVSKLGEDGVAKALSEAQMLRLPEEDLQLIAQKFADINSFTLDSERGGLSALGSGVFDEIEKYRTQNEKLTAQYTGAFSGIAESVRANLGGHLSEIERMRKYLQGNPAVADVARQISETPDYFKRPRFADEPILNVAPVRLPNLEDGPIGRTARAGEEAAAQLREVAGLTGQMVSEIGKLNQAVITQVLPAWFASLKDDAEATRDAARQAQSNLFWAKWALIASVVATLGTAAWQVWLTRGYELESDQQQATIERLLKEQVGQNKRLVEAQESQSAAMKEFLSRPQQGSVGARNTKNGSLLQEQRTVER